MALVRLYEDIDGCLNAEYNARAWRTDGEIRSGYQRDWVHPEYDDYGFRKGPGLIKYRMEWNEYLITALNELPVEFVWATTWRTDALKVGTAMKLMHSPQRILHPLNFQTTFPSIDWKYEAILHEQDHDPSPFIAVDDEWAFQPEYCEALSSIGGLVISPDPNIGITPKHVSMMRAYIDGHS
jgi:hypothetical protein